MVNLIITLVGIALVIIVSIAALYNGGEVFKSGSAKAERARLQNEANQINVAAEYFKVKEIKSATNIDELVDNNYLKEKPKGFGSIDESGTEWFFVALGNSNYSVTSIENEEKAIALHKESGETDMPDCFDASGDFKVEGVCFDNS